MHCWRHKTPIIFRATTQWFVGMDDVPGFNGAQAGARRCARRALHGRRRDAVLSRLGARAAARHDREPSRLDALAPAPVGRADAVLRRTARPASCIRARSSCSKRVAKRVEKGGIEAWQGVDRRSRCSATTRRITRRSATRSTSGSTPAHALHGAAAGRARRRGSHATDTHFPADLYLEGSDQHRGWFHSSLLVSSHAERRAAVQRAAHARLRRRRRRAARCRKSQGQRHRAAEGHATRSAPRSCACGSAATDYSGELSISDEILKRVVEGYRRIRNTLRFLLANTVGLRSREATRCRSSEWLEIDRYALAMTRAMAEPRSPTDYERYEFHLVAQRLQTFCSEDLGGFYLDILKDRLYTTPRGSAARGARRRPRCTTSREALLRLMAPILSFTAEEAWEVLHPDGRERSSSTPGRTCCRRARRATALRRALGAHPARCARPCRRSSRRCARGAGSAPRCRPRSSVTPRRRRCASCCARSATICASCSSPRRRACARGPMAPVDVDGHARAPQREVRALLALARRRRRRRRASGALRALRREPLRRRRGARAMRERGASRGSAALDALAAGCRWS